MAELFRFVAQRAAQKKFDRFTLRLARQPSSFVSDLGALRTLPDARDQIIQMVDAFLSGSEFIHDIDDVELLAQLTELADMSVVI